VVKAYWIIFEKTMPLKLRVEEKSFCTSNADTVYQCETAQSSAREGLRRARALTEAGSADFPAVSCDEG
jgi:hypothetical protein